MTMGMTKRGLSGGDVDAKIATHSGNSSGVHGAGLSTLETIVGSQGKANAAQAAAIAASDPAGSAAAAVNGHKDLGTGVHGAGISTLETVAGSQSKANAAQAASDPAGSAAAAVNGHKDISTGVHGAGGNNFVYSNNAALTDARTPLNHGSDKHTVAYDAAGAATAAVDGHKDLATGIHGAGLNNFVYSDNAALTNARTPTNHGNEAHTSAFITGITHAATTGQTANDHHAQSHGNADHTSVFITATGVEMTANKGAVSGYCGLDAAQKVATANLGGAGADATKFLRGDQTWQVVAAGGTDLATVWAFGS